MNSFISNLLDEELYSTHFLFETTQDFIERITVVVMQEFKIHRTYVNSTEQLNLAEELRLEISLDILRLLRIKTYGYYDLQSFRRHVLMNLTN